MPRFTEGGGRVRNKETGQLGTVCSFDEQNDGIPHKSLGWLVAWDDTGGEWMQEADIEVSSSPPAAKVMHNPLYNSDDDDDGTSTDPPTQVTATQNNPSHKSDYNATASSYSVRRALSYIYLATELSLDDNLPKRGNRRRHGRICLQQKSTWRRNTILCVL
jgi:hypothetical protein